MEYRFKSNKNIDEITNRLSSILFKDKLTAIDSIWDNKIEEKGKIFYGNVMNNHFSLKRLSTNARLQTPSFTGEIIETENDTTEIIGHFKYYFIFNNAVYLIFLLITLFLGNKCWIHLNLFSFYLVEIFALVMCLLPMEFFRRREKQKIINVINELI